MIADLVLLAVVPVGLWIAVLHERVRTLQSQVIRDPLTGAFNRMQMQVAIAAAIERRRRSGDRASLLYLDLDHFRDVNDALGYAAGDRVLKDLVAIVGQRLRKLDGLFRIGGEEFAVLLSGAGLSQSVAIAETLRHLVKEAGLVPGRPLSISIGVVELGAGQSVADWIAAAEAALYLAKRAGLNRGGARVAAPPVTAGDAGHCLAFPVRTP